MKQECLNSLMTIHVHKDKTDKLELRATGMNLLRQMRKERIYLAPFPDLFNLYFQTLFFIRKALAE